MLKNMKTKNETLTSEELKEFKDVYEGSQKAVYDLGALEIETNRLKKRLDELNSERINLLSHIDVLVERQASLSAQLGDKYGMKTVDLETGELK
jgi:hypothetical protein